MPEPLVVTRSIVTRPVAPPSPFRCTLMCLRPGRSCVQLAGELDVASAPDVELALRNALWLTRLVVIDLRALTFLGAAGVRVIVNATIRGRHDGRRVVILRGPPHVDRVFDLSETAHHVEIVDDLDQPSWPSRRDVHLRLV